MPGRAARALVPALVVLGLVGVVAVASNGSIPTGTSETRRPADQLLDSFFSLMLFLLVVAAVVTVWAFTQREQIAREAARVRRQRLGLFGLSVIFLVFTTITYFRMRGWDPPDFRVDLGQLGGTEDAPTADEVYKPGPQTYDPEFTWTPIVVVVGLAAIAVAAWYFAARRDRVQLTPEQAAAGALAAVLDDTLDDLRAEKDPRRAVIAAYARLERTLAAHRLGRHPSEAPGEYLARILPELELERGSVRRLTELFTRAKFSPHAIDAAMKEDAIDALTTVRDELRAAAERRRQERLAALEAAPERR
jgi:4-amino-4-deoxy-L-arabinose transferase-like glycosyltransferase